MSRIGRLLKGILVWSFERGTWHYDVICVLILLFIFLTPRSCFAPRNADSIRSASGSGTEASAGAASLPRE